MEAVGGCVCPSDRAQTRQQASLSKYETHLQSKQSKLERRTPDPCPRGPASKRAVRQKNTKCTPECNLHQLPRGVFSEKSNRTSDDDPGGNRPMSFPRMRRQKNFTSARRGSLCLREHATVSAAWRSASGIPKSRLRLERGWGGALDTRSEGVVVVRETAINSAV